MVDKRVKVTLDADAGRMVTGFRQAEAAAGRFSTSIEKNRASWDKIGDTAMIAGGAMVAGLGLAAKAAIDWESAWAGVAKTVDGTPQQMAELEAGLRGLARELPATHEEIAGVAEAAGQLGVARKDVLGFTETAIALGESTNLSAEEAATSLAQFSNIMGTATREGVEGYERLGSTLVELGNNGASTEKDIMSMALRLAGAGQQIGATEADILAMSNALTSVGIEAELGGGAMSRGLLQMNSAVISGGEELDKFAQIAGMSASEFATAWRKDPIEATNAFIGGLGRIGDSGGDASAALESVGLSGTQNAQVFLRAAGASDLMTQSLKDGSSAWSANTALQEEAAKRYETDASRIQISMNRIKDAMISFGAAVAPVLAGAAEAVAGLADWFGRLPGPVQTFISALTGVTGGTLLLGGAAIKAVGFAQDLSGALTGISGPAGKAGGAIDGANRSMAGVGRWAGYAAGIAAVVTALNAIEDAATPTPASVEEVTSAILDLDRAGNEVTGLKNVNQIFKDLDDQSTLQRALMDTSVGVDGLADAYRRLNDPTALESTNNVIDSMQGWIGMTGDVEKLEGVFKTFGQSLADMPADEAARQFDLMVQSIGGGEATAKRLLELMPAYADKLKQGENAARMAGEGADAMGGDLQGLGTEVETIEDKIERLSDEITGLGDAMLGQRGSARDYQAALDDMASSISENGRTLDITTEKGRANEAALDGLAESTQEWAAATLESGGSAEKVQGILDNGRQKWIDYATSMGMPKREAKALADELFTIPADVKTEFKAAGATEAIGQAGAFGAAIGMIPGSKSSNISAPGAEESRGRVLGLGSSIETLYGKTVQVKEDGATVSEANIRELDGSLLGLPSNKTVTVAEIGSTKSGEMVVQFKNKVYAIPKSKTAQIREQGAGNARAKVMDLNTSIKLLNGKTVKVGEDGAQNATGKIRTMDGAIFGLKGKTVTVREIGATESGGRVVRFKDNIYEVPESRTSNVRANVHGLWDVGALVGQIAGVRDKTVTITAISRKIGSWYSADGNMYSSEGGFHQSFADGGTFRGKQPQIRPAGGAGVTWAEEGAGPWEAFISGHPGKKARSVAILDQVAARLGRATMPLDSVKFASGGVYGDWQKWLRYARRLSAQSRYKFEDGSRKIRVFEDGTAQWRGYGGMDATAARAIRNLNAAQDRYENALNARERRQSQQRSAPVRRAPKKWQHSAEYNRKQAEWARIRQQRSTAQRRSAPRVSAKPKWQHSDYYIRKQAEWAAIRKREAAKPRTGEFTRITPPPPKQHMVVPERWGRFERTPATTSSTSSPMSAQVMEQAIVSAFSRVRVTTTINGRDFQGVINRTAADRKGR